MKLLVPLLIILMPGLSIMAQKKADSLKPDPPKTFTWSDTLKQPDFNQGVISDPLRLILGKEPGAEVFKAGSDPSVPSLLMIRGNTTLYSNASPIYVIDGIVGADFFMLPPGEIESVKILKNLAETSFYGCEGAGGVVLVTTKRGNPGKKLSVSFNTSVTLGQTTGKLDLFTAQEMRDRAILYPEIDFLDGGANTDWQQEIYRTTVAQSYQLALGGTLKNTSYRLSFNHMDQPGNVKGSDRKLTGGAISLTQTAFKKKLQVEALVSWYQSNSDRIQYPAGRFEENPLYQGFTHNPTDPVYNSTGSYDQTQRVFLYYNPVAILNMITSEVKTDQVSAVLNARWDIWKGLGIKVTGSYSGNNTNLLYDCQANAYPGAYAYRQEGSDDYTRLELLAGLTYNRRLGKHHDLDLFAGYVVRSFTSDVAIEAYNGFLLGDMYRSSFEYTDWALRANLNYSFRQKYHLGFVINQEHYESNAVRQQDGTDLAWGQWAFYPGVTVSWDIHREGFMKGLDAVSTLTLSGSYGLAGATPPAQSISEYNPGYNTQELEMETTTELTASLDAGFLRNRILARIGYYHRNTPNMIIRQSLPVPPNLSPFAYVNGMELTNSGFEVKVMARVIDGKTTTWNSILGFSSNRNKVDWILNDISIPSGYVDYYLSYSNSTFVMTTTTGSPLLAFNLPVFVKYDGGFPVYEKITGGYTTSVNQAKRQLTGDVYPDFILSWTNAFTLFKSVDLSLMLQYVGGHRIFNGTRMYLSVPDNFLVLNTLPEAETNYADGVKRIPFSDMYLEKGSYLRLENLSAGYTWLPKNIKWKGSLRVYLAVNNLFTITGYSGLDPAFNPNSAGLDYFNTYPKTRTYTLGISLEI
jgi:iron complex outermembrane receptor protein